MALTHVATTGSSATSATNPFAPTVPAHLVGDLLVAFVKRINTTADTASVTGWTIVSGPVGIGSGTASIMYKIATATNDTLSVTGGATANAWTGVVSVWRGHDTTTPLIVPATAWAGGTCSSTTMSGVSVTTDIANCVYLDFHSGTSATSGTTYTETWATAELAEFQHTSLLYHPAGAAYANIAAAGATGTELVTASASLSNQAIGAVAIRPVAAAVTTLTQSTFRGRNDDGSETTATWKALAGVDWTQLVDTNFRVRFNIADSVAAATQNTAFVLRYSLNGGAYTAVSGASSIVRATASPNIVDGVATTEQLAGAGTFNTGTIDEVDGSALGFTAATATGQDTEVEYSVQIRSVDVVDGDTVALRVYRGTTALDTYTDWPVITVSEPDVTPPAAPTGLTLNTSFQ